MRLLIDDEIEWYAETRLHILEKLLEQGIDVNAKDDDDRTALHECMISNYWDDWKFREPFAERLLAAGAELDAREKNGRTPLMYCVEYSNPSQLLPAVEFLFSRGADITVQDKWGDTALIIYERTHEDTRWWKDEDTPAHARIIELLTPKTARAGNDAAAVVEPVRPYSEPQATDSRTNAAAPQAELAASAEASLPTVNATQAEQKPAATFALADRPPPPDIADGW